MTSEEFHMYSPQPAKVQPALSFRWLVACDNCSGWGWYTETGYEEMYCHCEAGKWRRIYDGGTAAEHFAPEGSVLEPSP